MPGLRLHVGGAGAQPKGDDWDPMTYPVDPITASEPSLNERVRIEGTGLFGVDALLGLAFRVSEAGQLVALAEGGWRQIRADLVHEQYVEGQVDSARVLRRTGDFAWGGAAIRRSPAWRLSVGCLEPWRVSGLVADAVSRCRIRSDYSGDRSRSSSWVRLWAAFLAFDYGPCFLAFTGVKPCALFSCLFLFIACSEPVEPSTGFGGLGERCGVTEPCAEGLNCRGGLCLAQARRRSSANGRRRDHPGFGRRNPRHRRGSG